MAAARRRFRGPAAVQVLHFQKLLALKFDLSDGDDQHVVEIYCRKEKLPPTMRLMDVAYKTAWDQVPANFWNTSGTAEPWKMHSPSLCSP